MFLTIVILFYYFQTGTATKVLTGHRNVVQCCAFSHNDKFLVSLQDLLGLSSLDSSSSVSDQQRVGSSPGLETCILEQDTFLWTTFNSNFPESVTKSLDQI